MARITVGVLYFDDGAFVHAATEGDDKGKAKDTDESVGWIYVFSCSVENVSGFFRDGF